MKGIVSPSELDLTMPRGGWFIDAVLRARIARHIAGHAPAYWTDIERHPRI